MPPMDDKALVSWQLGRPARAFREVAVRCRHGFPAVTKQEPSTDDGEPFPTTYYPTCPWLVAEVSRLEAAGGVACWTRTAQADTGLRRSLAEAQAEQRALRPALDAGIAGTLNDGQLKCLHAHVAFALARPGYALGTAITEEIPERWCPDRRCEAAHGD